MLKQAIILLSKPKEKRNERDIEIYLKPIVTQLDFFKERL